MSYSSTLDFVNIAEGRLTLTQGTPVTTSDVTAATYVYYEPYIGDRLSLWYAPNTWKPYRFNASSISVAVPATTVTPFDIYAYASGSTIAMETVNWTSDTTRAVTPARVNGVLVNPGNYGRRYIGTGRTTSSSGQTEDSYGGAHQSGGKRFLWNMYNRVTRHLGVIDTTDSWTYTNVFRQANGASGNKVEWVVGIGEDAYEVSAFHHVSQATSAVSAATGVGIDSTSTNSAQGSGLNVIVTASLVFGATAMMRGVHSLGYHYAAWLEGGSAAGTTTWYGDGGVSGGLYSAGLVMTMRA